MSDPNQMNQTSNLWIPTELSSLKDDFHGFEKYLHSHFDDDGDDEVLFF